MLRTLKAIIIGKIRSLIWSLVNATLRADWRYITACHISFFVPINIKIPHPVGIIIGRGAKIGSNVVIMQNVTIGVERLGSSESPTIGDNCVLGAGCVIVGNVKIPEGTIVRANSVISSKSTFS